MNAEQWNQYSIARRNRHKLPQSSVRMLDRISRCGISVKLPSNTAAALNRISAEVGRG